MTQPASAREDILGRIRSALPGEVTSASVAASYASIPRSYQRNGRLSREDCIGLFVDRLVDYEAQVVQLGDERELAAAIAKVMEAAGEDRLLTSPAMPMQWVPDGVELLIDNDLPPEEIDRAHAVLTTCEIAIAATGTIVLVHGGAQGRRVVTLLPDHHICVVRRSQVYELVPESFAKLESSGRHPITTISGPSATSDIEMIRIRGVHGPRRLTVLLYGLLTESAT